MPAEKRESDIGSRELASEWRDLIGIIPGAESVTFRAEFGRTSSPIDVQLSGSSIDTPAVAEKGKRAFSNLSNSERNSRKQVRW